MLMSVAEIARDAGVYPELSGSRVLITGLGPTCGVDITRAFAEHSCRLILQIPDPCPETDALLQIIAETALDVRVHHDPIDQAETATRFAQSAPKKDPVNTLLAGSMRPTFGHVVSRSTRSRITRAPFR